MLWGLRVQGSRLRGRILGCFARVLHSISYAFVRISRRLYRLLEVVYGISDGFYRGLKILLSLRPRRLSSKECFVASVFQGVEEFLNQEMNPKRV